MEPETETVIDVEVTEIDSSLRESIERWYSAAQVQRILNLNKSGLQKAIAKLQDIVISNKKETLGSAVGTDEFI